MKINNPFPEKIHEYIGLVGVLLLQGLCLHYFWGQIGDDSYIFFRYAANLAEHGALVWNIGEIPVEGFSSPLWVLLLAGLAPLLDIVWASKFLGAIFAVFSLIRVWQISEKNTLSVLGASLGMGFLYWSVSGLETSLYCFLLLSSLLALRGNASVFWIALLGLVRPEAPFLLFIGVGILFWKQRRWDVWFLMVPTLVYLGFRLWYFGDLLPNTYFAKATGDPITQILRGLQYSLLPIVAVFFLWKNEILEYTEMLIPLLVLGIVIGGGGDWMWHDRLLVPIYLVLWSWSGLFCGFRRIGMMVVLLSTSVHWRHWDDIIRGNQLSMLEYQEGTLVEASRQVAEEIEQNIPTGATIAINHAGALPYFLLDYSFIDMTGLNDRWIARKKGSLHEKFDSEYVLDQEPDLIVMNSLSNPKAGFTADYWEGERDLFENPRFKQEYAPISRSWKRRRYLGAPAFIVLFVRVKKD